MNGSKLLAEQQQLADIINDTLLKRVVALLLESELEIEDDNEHFRLTSSDI